VPILGKFQEAKNKWFIGALHPNITRLIAEIAPGKFLRIWYFLLWNSSLMDPTRLLDYWYCI